MRSEIRMQRLGSQRFGMPGLGSRWITLGSGANLTPTCQSTPAGSVNGPYRRNRLCPNSQCSVGGGEYFYDDFQDANDVASLISCHYEQFIKFTYAASVFLFCLCVRCRLASIFEIHESWTIQFVLKASTRCSCSTERIGA